MTQKLECKIVNKYSDQVISMIRILRLENINGTDIGSYRVTGILMRRKYLNIIVQNHI